jgi:hypothetical protein
MKKFLLAMAMLLGIALPDVAAAQVVVPLPVALNANSVVDLGNGPLELRVLLGNAWLFTASGSSTETAGTSGSPNLTVALNLSPAPLVGAIVSGVGVVSGTTVVSYTAGTGVIVLSANLSANAAGVYSFGIACPAFAAGLPTPNIALQAGGSQNDLPIYTQARICGYAANGPGATLLPFPIGAH